jgi:hypothetical protein
MRTSKCYVEYNSLMDWATLMKLYTMAFGISMLIKSFSIFVIFISPKFKLKLKRSFRVQSCMLGKG